MANLRWILMPLLLLAASATAQVTSPDLRGPIREIRVEGTETFADIVRTIIVARSGSAAERVDLEAERNRVYALGTFAEVTASLEDRGAGPILIIRVVENPPVAGVEVAGADLLNAGQLANAIVAEHMLDIGRTLNSLRAERAIETLQNIYRSVGVPYDIDVTLELVQAPEASVAGRRVPVRLRYTVDEGASLRRIEFEPSAVLSAAELERLFSNVQEEGAFAFAAYRAAVDAVAQRYNQAGLRQSGIDLERTTLEGGLLTVRFRELRIAAFDTTALGIDASQLTLKVGDLFNYDTLLDDVRRLALGRSSDVRIETLASASGAVRVRFALGAPATAGPISAIVVEGNTRIDSETLIALFGLQVGDTFTSALADEDFRRIRVAYDTLGVVIEGQPSYNYLDGTYVQRVREVTIERYDLVYDGSPGRTVERVITRYLPKPGEVVDFQAIDTGLRSLARLGVVTPLNRLLRPAETPGAAVVEILLRSVQTGLFQPGAQYNTESGFSASVSFSEGNLWGLAHSAGVEVTALTGDLGFQFGGSIRYSVPWLDIPLADFQENPTSVSVAFFTIPEPNQPITANGLFRVHYPGLTPSDATLVPVGEALRRSTGASFSISRRVLPLTTLSFSVRGGYDSYRLEPPRAPCAIVDGAVTNAANCALPEADAAQYLPQGGLNLFSSTVLSFDGRDNDAFPRQGVAASVGLGVGWGNDQVDALGNQTTYTYQQLQAGVKTYLTPADFINGFNDRNHVFAVRLNGGILFGDNAPVSRNFRVGRTINEATEIRGYQDSDFALVPYYVTSSLEYRYDFNFSTFATETVVAVVFADLAWVPNTVRDPLAAPDFYGGMGVGLQLNLGFGGVGLPALRFDYGFSTQNPNGVFAFRIGSVF